MTSSTAHQALKLIVAHGEHGIPSSRLAFAAMSDRGIAGDRAFWDQLTSIPNLPADVRARLLTDPRASIKIHMLNRGDLTPDETAALLEGETRPTVIAAAWENCVLPYVPAAFVAKVMGPDAAYPADPHALLAAIAACNETVPGGDGSLDGFWALLAVHPELAPDALEHLYTNPRTMRWHSVARLAGEPYKTHLLSPEALALHPAAAGVLMSYPNLIDTVTPYLADAVELVSGEDGALYRWWIDAIGGYAPFRVHSSSDERAALPDQILELLRTSVAVDTRVLSAFRRPLLPEQVQVILDGIDGIGPNAGLWPDPGTQPRRAWTMKLLRSLELTLVEVLPTALLLELLRDHPGPLLTLGLHSGDVCARLAQVLPDAAAAWTDPRDQWDGFWPRSRSDRGTRTPSS